MQQVRDVTVVRESYSHRDMTSILYVLQEQIESWVYVPTSI